MAAVNEAWRVLGDPARRANYDASLRPRAVVVGAPASTVPRPAPVAEAEEGRSFFAVALPWMLVLGVLGGIFLFTAYARDGLDGGSVTTHARGDRGRRRRHRLVHRPRLPGPGRRDERVAVRTSA